MKVSLFIVISGVFSLLFSSVLNTAVGFVLSINTYLNYLKGSFVIKNLLSVLFQDKFFLCYDR